MGSKAHKFNQHNGLQQYLLKYYVIILVLVATICYGNSAKRLMFDY